MNIDYKRYNLIDERLCQSYAMLDAVIENPELPRHLQNALWGVRELVRQAREALDGE